MRINALKAKVMSALTPGEDGRAALIDGEPMEDAD